MDILSFIFLIVTSWLSKASHAFEEEALLTKCTSQPPVMIQLGTGPDGKPFFLDVALPSPILPTTEAPSTTTPTTMPTTPDTKTILPTCTGSSKGPVNSTVGPGLSVSKAHFSALSIALPLFFLFIICVFGAVLLYKKKMATSVAPSRGTSCSLSRVYERNISQQYLTTNDAATSDYSRNPPQEYERSISQQHLTTNDAATSDHSRNPPKLPPLLQTLDADVEAAVPQGIAPEEKKKKKRKKKKKKKPSPEYERSISQQQLIPDSPGVNVLTENGPQHPQFVESGLRTLSEVCVPWQESSPQTNVGFQNESSL